jgi:hypothetical protein
MEHDLELYIQIRDGQPYEHPILADNFRQAFPDIDTNNLPLDRFAKFIRVSPPEIGNFEIDEGCSYQWVDGVVKDIHLVRQMTDEERVAKQLELDISNANNTHLFRIKYCQTIADETEDANQKQLWLDCFAAHKAWVLESVDPITPAFPLFPRKDEGGNWVAP